MSIATFKLTQEEILLSAAATLLLKGLESADTTIKRVSDICQKPQYGFTASASYEPIGPHFVRITDIQRGNVNWNKVPFCPDPSTTSYDVAPGDLLIARSGATVGKSFLVREIPSRAVFASYLIRLRVNADIPPSFLYWCLQSKQFWEQVSKGRRGSAMPNVNGQVLANLRFPIPRRGLQEAIVSFLESFRIRLSGGRVELPSLPPPLTDQRRIVIRIEKLTAKIEEAQYLRRQAVQETNALLKVSSESMLGVPNKKVGDVAQVTKLAGFEYTKYFTHAMPGDVVVIRAGNVRNTGLDLSNAMTITKEVSDALPRSQLKPGDVVMTFIGAKIGDVTFVQRDNPRLHCGPNVAKLTPNEQISHVYLVKVLQSPLIQDQIQEITKSTAQPSLSMRTIRLLSLPVPPIAEQNRIVSHLNKLQASVNSLRSLQEESAAELGNLQFSILDTAFKEEL